MNTKTARLILLVFVLVLVSVGPASAEDDVVDVDFMSFPPGEVVAADILPKGGSVAVLIGQHGVTTLLSVVHIDRAGLMRVGQIGLPHDKPDRLFIGVCGENVKILVNWTASYDLETAPVVMYNFILNEDTGRRCDGSEAGMKLVSFPFVPILPAIP